MERSAVTRPAYETKILMRKNPTSQSALFNLHALVTFGLCWVGVLLATLSFAATPSSRLTESPATANAATLTGTIITVAGGLSGTVPALSSNLFPIGVARDAQGNIYVADLRDNIVRRTDLSGNITTVAGNDTLGFSGDGGSATQAQLDGPAGIAVDLSGNLYIADSLNNRVRRVTPAGVISTFAGGGTTGVVNNGDGMAATSASLSDPERIAVDPAGNVYIADVNHSEVRKVDTSGTISTYAGKSGFSYSGDGGPATSATFAGIGGLAWMSDGSLFIADTYDNRIRRVDASGIITTVAGNGAGSDSGDGGPATAAGVYHPVDVAADGTGGYWIAEADGGRVRHIDSQGIITTINVPGLIRPQGVAAAEAGGVLISDVNARLLRLHGADGTNTAIAGNGSASFSGIGVPAVDASLAFPTGVAFDNAGNMYIADELNYMVRRVSPAGIITTFAGSGQPPCRTLGCSQNNGDGGPATQAILASPIAVAVDTAGNTYIAEYESSLVRKVDTRGIISTYAGGGNNGLGDNGPASAAQLNTPYGLTIAPDGSLVIADTFDNRVRRVDGSGTITTIAGNGTGGYTGDNGPATAAELSHPAGVAYDNAGNLYIADFSNLRVRKVTTAATISTVAGNGQADTGGTGFGDGLPAIAAALSGPYSVAVDASGNLYISDQSDDRIREVDTTGTMSTVTGTGKFGYSGDGGPASSAQDWWPSGTVIGPGGALYFADQENSRVRGINVPLPVQLTGVRSRKVHGSAGTFDVDLPLTGNSGIECRSGGANGNYTLVFSFSNPLTGVGGASIASGTGSVAGNNIDSSDAHNYIVNLTGVTNAQYITVSLANVTDSAGNFSSAVSATMGVLIGDVNASKLVDGNDVSAVQSHTRQSVTSANFRFDVNATGGIDGNDVSITQGQTRTSLP
jgi:hypothetical protein